MNWFMRPTTAVLALSVGVSALVSPSSAAAQASDDDDDDGLSFGITWEVEEPMKVTVERVPGRTDQLSVTWNPIDGTSIYWVRWKLSSDAAYHRRNWQPASPSDTAKELTSTIRNLSPGTTYDVKVIARVGAIGSMVDGETAEGSGTTNYAMGAVTVRPVSGATSKLAVSWADVADEEGYVVRWKKAADTAYGSLDFKNLAANTTSYQVEGLSAGTAYDVKVTARASLRSSAGSAVGTGDSSTASATTLHALDWVWVLNPNLAPTTLGVLWSGVTGATGYRLEWKRASDTYYTNSRTFAADANKPGGEAVLSGLAAYTAYNVKVTARVTIGGQTTDGASARASAATRDVLGPITVAAAPNRDDSLRVTWNDVRGETSYLIKWKPTTLPHFGGSTHHRAAAGTTSHVITGLEADTSYDVQVSTFVADGTQGDAAEASGSTVTSAGTVTVKPVYGTTSSLKVLWDKFGGAGGYRVQWKRSAAAGYRAADSVSMVADEDGISFAYTIRGLAAGTSYDVRVTARVTSGNRGNRLVDGNSAVGSGTTVHAIGPVTVAPMVGTTDQLGVAWDPVPGSAYYWVQWKLRTDRGFGRPGQSQATLPGANSYRIRGLAADTAYDVKVTAFVTLGGDTVTRSSSTGSGRTAAPADGEGSGVPVRGSEALEPGDKPLDDRPSNDGPSDRPDEDRPRSSTRAPTTFTDVDPDSVHLSNIDRLYAAGITNGCGVSPLRYCPDLPVTRAQMASFLSRALKLSASEVSMFVDVHSNNVHAANVDRLMTAGVTVGCDTGPLRYCPDLPVTRGQMASFLARARNLPAAASAGFVDVDARDVHMPNIDRLYAAQITVGCADSPRRYCPHDPVTRAQMASFLSRALGLPTESRARV